MTFYLTTAGFVIPSVTGSLSCISSLAIIYIIVRSKSNTTYHRILFLMSFCDTLGSFAIALTTIPMPKDVIYPFAGPSYGNTATCEAQGLVYITGSAIVISMNGILNIYYVCTLRYKMKAETFSKIIEPILTVFAIAVPVVTIITVLANQGLINPSLYESYCSVGTYPGAVGSNERDDTERSRGGGSNGIVQFRFVFFFTMVTGLGTLATSMFLIILTFYQSERSVKRTRTTMMQEHVKEDGSPTDTPTETTTDGPHSTTNINKQEEEAGHQESQHNMTKTITIQALMYLGAFVFTWIFSVLGQLGDVFLQNYWIQALKLVFQPLQGFFNMLIFIHHKVYNLRRTNKDLSVSEALLIIFAAPSMISEVRISQLIIVHEYEYKNKFQKYEPNIGSVIIHNGEVIGSSTNASVLESSVNKCRDDEAYMYTNEISFASGSSMEASTTSRKGSQLSAMESFDDNDLGNFADDDLSYPSSLPAGSD